MAIASSPASQKMVSAKKMERSETNKRKQQDGDNANQPKRSKCPGVRVVGSRIYDSQNGKTCHQVIFLFFVFCFFLGFRIVPTCIFCLAGEKMWRNYLFIYFFRCLLLFSFFVFNVRITCTLQCRQKTRDFVASCKNLKKDRLCTINFCHKCLSNRFFALPRIFCIICFFIFYFFYAFTCRILNWGYIMNLDMEKTQKKWHCWMIGTVPNAEAFVIAVSACKCFLLANFFSNIIVRVDMLVVSKKRC